MRLSERGKPRSFLVIHFREYLSEIGIGLFLYSLSVSSEDFCCLPLWCMKRHCIIYTKSEYFLSRGESVFGKKCILWDSGFDERLKVSCCEVVVSVFSSKGKA